MKPHLKILRNLGIAEAGGGTPLEPNFEEPSLEKAIQLFKEWGFLVEQGPRPEEVTLIHQGPTHRSSHVFEVALLPKLAVAALQVRWCNGVVLRHLQDAS